MANTDRVGQACSNEERLCTRGKEKALWTVSFLTMEKRVYKFRNTHSRENRHDARVGWEQLLELRVVWVNHTSKGVTTVEITGWHGSSRWLYMEMPRAGLQWEKWGSCACNQMWVFNLPILVTHLQYTTENLTNRSSKEIKIVETDKLLQSRA